jgi:hypothetical protein
MIDSGKTQCSMQYTDVQQGTCLYQLETQEEPMSGLKARTKSGLNSLISVQSYRAILDVNQQAYLLYLD